MSLGLDMGITIQNRNLIEQYESNVVFRSLYTKYNTVVAVTFQMLIEISFVFMMPFLFDKNNFTVDIHASGLIAAMISVLHFIAWHNNKKIIKIIPNSINDKIQ